MMPTIIEDEVLYFVEESCVFTTNEIEHESFTRPYPVGSYEEPIATFELVDRAGTVIDTTTGTRVTGTNMFEATLTLPNVKGQYSWRAEVTTDSFTYRQREKIYVYPFE
jgi:hypothetical protein